MEVKKLLIPLFLFFLNFFPLQKTLGQGCSRPPKEDININTLLTLCQLPATVPVDMIKEGIRTNNASYKEQTITEQANDFLASRQTKCNQNFSAFLERTKKEKKRVKLIRQDIIQTNQQKKSFKDSCSSEEQNLSLCQTLNTDFKNLEQSELINIYAKIPNHFPQLPVSQDCSCLENYKKRLRKLINTDEKSNNKNFMKKLHKEIQKLEYKKVKGQFNTLLEDAAALGISPQKLGESCSSVFNTLKKNKHTSHTSLSELFNSHSHYTPTPPNSDCPRYSRKDYKSNNYFSLGGDAKPMKKRVRNAFNEIKGIITSQKAGSLKKCLKSEGRKFNFLSIIEALQSSKVNKECTELQESIKTAKIELTEFFNDLSLITHSYPEIRQWVQLPLEIKRKTEEIDIPDDIFTLVGGDNALKNSLDMVEKRCSDLNERMEYFQKNKPRTLFNNKDQAQNFSPYISKKQFAHYLNTIYKKWNDDNNDPNNVIDRLKLLTKFSSFHCEQFQNKPDQTQKISVARPLDTLPLFMSSNDIAAHNQEAKKYNKQIDDEGYSCPAKEKKSIIFNVFHQHSEDQCSGKMTGPNLPPEVAESLRTGDYSPNSTIFEVAQTLNQPSHIDNPQDQIQKILKNDPRYSEKINENNENNFANNSYQKKMSEKSFWDYNTANSTKSYGTKKLVQTIKDLKKNEKEIEKISSEYKEEVLKNPDLNPDQIEKFEKRLAELERENRRLKGELNAMARDKENQDKKKIAANSPVNSPVRRSIPATRSQYTQAQKNLNKHIKNPGSQSQSSASNQISQSLSHLNGSQISGLAYQVAGNQDFDSPVTINLKTSSPLELSNIENTLKNIDPQQALIIKKALIEQKPIIFVNDQNKKIQIEYGSKEYILLTKHYQKELNTFVKQMKEKGGKKGKLMAKEIEKNYTDLVGNALSIID